MPAATCAIGRAPIFSCEGDVRLLVTRPQVDAERTAAALRALDHSVVMAPLLQIETLTDAAIGAGPWDGILVTSASAARAIASHKALPDLLGLPVIAAGDRSSDAMRMAGFADVVSAPGGAKELVRAAAQRFSPGASLLYLAGADRSGDVAGDLKARSIAVSIAVVYRAVAVAALPPAAEEALVRGIDGVLHFSRRSAGTYVNVLAARLRETALERPAHFCLSSQVAEPLTRAGARQIWIAQVPTEAALIALTRTF
jgi:uroporphyrinogen-III synthase